MFNFGQVVRQNDYGGQTFLYSRRIGRQPQLGVPDEHGVRRHADADHHRHRGEGDGQDTARGRSACSTP